MPAEPVPDQGAVAGAEPVLDDVLVARPGHDHEGEGALDRPGPAVSGIAPSTAPAPDTSTVTYLDVGRGGPVLVPAPDGATPFSASIVGSLRGKFALQGSEQQSRE